jgi:predicted NAD/FAD-binding protein
MKIAIVGSGISGLTAAHHLHPGHEITLFEAGGHVGGHVDTHEVELGGRCHAVDTGFIVFNHRTYPRFVELLADLGVDSQPSEMSFSVSCGETGLEYNGTSLNGLFAQRGNLLKPSFWCMLNDILRFNREAPALLRTPGEEISLGEFLERGHYGARFRDYYLLPIGAAIWSTDPARMLDFPARFFVAFFSNHGLLSVSDRPRRRLAWAAWNYLMPHGPGGWVSLTYDMNILQGIDADKTLCVTLNAGERIDPDKVIARMIYQHPLFTREGTAAQARHREIDGSGRTYYCGAWWGNGFHEDGVVSALDALRHFNDDRLHLRAAGRVMP